MVKGRLFFNLLGLMLLGIIVFGCKPSDPVVSASNNFVSGMDRLYIGDFLIYSGRNSDRERMLAANFDLPGFAPYNREKLINNEDDDNYHVFKSNFSVSKDFEDKELTLYIDYFDMPVIIHINDITIYRKGLKQETKRRVYSTGYQVALDVPLAGELINYDEENSLVVEVFPLYETNSMPELSIAEYKDNAQKVFFKNFFNTYLVIAAQFLAILVALYHFVLFLSRGCKDKKYLIFSFLSMSFALAYANIGFSFDSNYYNAIIKITRSFQLLCFGFYSLYIIESSGLFPKQKKYIVTGIIIFSLTCAAFVALQKDKHMVNLAFSVISNIYIIPLLLLCIVFPVLSIILKKDYMLAPLLFTTLIVSVASLRDMVLLSSNIQPLFWYVPYAFLTLIIVIYAILVYEESKLFNHFKRYVPADLVIQLINRNITADLGGEQQELTVFFSDISKFTSIVEKMEPEKLIKDLCVYFESISKTILENKGTIDKFIGDSVMAFWGAPLPMENHAEKACHTAIVIQKNLRYLLQQEKIEFVTRIGIHTGSVIVGNLGYKERLNYTIIGDSVNVSSRIESINKIYGTEIIVSDSTYKECKDNFEFRLLDRVSLLGHSGGMNIYELISFKDEIDLLQKRNCELYEEGLQHYFRQNWDKAMNSFNEIIEYSPNDTPSRLMIDRCLQYKDNPPPEEWNGVFIQTAK
ncbi:MAG: adenylate/guanylate cyclase domain-containing protein [Treponema sp.]|jgi:class 3 adenylate cyclase|nr:adenylate/guanylate cyclase domain-containing protein [Treponema sp.]